MTYVIKKHVDKIGSWKKTHLPLGCFLCKMLPTSTLFRKTTLSLKLSSTYYLFVSIAECLLNSNISISKHRFKGAPKFRHCLNLMVSCVRPCIGTTLEGVDCLQVQIVWARCSKCKESVTREH